jgi:long-chain acyl-CoA synthetase
VAPAPIEEKLSQSPYVQQVMVLGAGRPFNAAVVVIDVPAVKRWAEAQGIREEDPAALSQDARVRALIQGELDRLGADLRGFEAVRGFVTTAEEFSLENDLLTPKLSLKRANVERRYADAVEALYRG